MLTVELLRDGMSVTGFRVRGHAGWDEWGKDVVCAGVSAACHMALVGLADVLGEAVDLEKGNGYMMVRVPVHAAALPEVKAILRAFELEIQAIERSYPGNVEFVDPAARTGRAANRQVSR
ncbi:MAG: ribosomal-processing cysteine protease Prp [Firmicutes bacterium]|nr:ribosomal-processing cysteine protease Prp [Candidatus Fermentithermobacillaceae bacterium]